MIVRDAVVQHVVDEDHRSTERWELAHAAKEPRLWPSALGGCVRKAYLDMWEHEDGHPFQEKPTHPPTNYLLELFELGRMYERQTFKALDNMYPGHVACNWPVGNEIWSGSIDYLVAQQAELWIGALVEHKSTNPVFNFTYGEDNLRLPRLNHCYQLLAYQHLVRCKLAGEVCATPPAHLYYRGWNKWAEFEVIDTADGILWHGQIGGRDPFDVRDVAGGFPDELGLQDEMACFEKWWASDMLPTGYESPLVEDFACVRKSRGRAWPRCKWFGACWPEWMDALVPFDVD